VRGSLIPNSNGIDLENLSSFIGIEEEHAVEDPVVVLECAGHFRCYSGEVKSRGSRRRVEQQCFIAVVANEMEFVERMQHLDVSVFVTLHLGQNSIHRSLYHPRWRVGSTGSFEQDPIRSRSCLTGLTVVSGQVLQKSRMKSCGVCALGCSAFRGSDRLSPSPFKKGEASRYRGAICR
jgi:hypothetical protein